MGGLLKVMSNNLDDLGKIILDNKNLDVLISSENLDIRIKELANQISKDYIEQGIKNIILICVLKGSIMFTADIAKNLNIDDIQMEFIAISSYRNETSAGDIELVYDLNADIKDKHVIIIEDIIDTGTTLNYLKKHLEKKNPASIKICTLLDKPSRRKVDVKVDYYGFIIEDIFVVGYGLDYKQKFRNLPYIGHIK